MWQICSRNLRDLTNPIDLHGIPIWVAGLPTMFSKDVRNKIRGSDVCPS